jgi:hypothetical protein
MLTIRQDQLVSLDKAMEKRYCEDLRKLFREKFPQLVGRLDDAVLLDRVSAGVRQARAYGASTGEGILAYVGLSLAAGPEFNSNPKIRFFLELPGSDPDQRIHRLFKRVLETLQRIPDELGDDSKQPTSGV